MMSEIMSVGVHQNNSAVSSNFFDSTKNAVESGIADARAAVEESWPKITDAVGNGIYNSAYGVAFGLTFPVLLVAKAIPVNNCFAWGFIDGAKAASAQAIRVCKK